MKCKKGNPAIRALGVESLERSDLAGRHFAHAFYKTGLGNIAHALADAQVEIQWRANCVTSVNVEDQVRAGKAGHAALLGEVEPVIARGIGADIKRLLACGTPPAVELVACEAVLQGLRAGSRHSQKHEGGERKKI